MPSLPSSSRRSLRRLIVTVIDELLLMQRAKELALAVSDAQFTQVLESIKKDNKIESEAAFEAALKSEGMTLAQLKQMLSKRILIGQVQQREIGSRVDVTEAEERAYYDAHISEFGTTPSVTLREIQVNARRQTRSRRSQASARSKRRARRQPRSARASSRARHSRKWRPRSRTRRRRPTAGSSARSRGMR